MRRVAIFDIDGTIFRSSLLIELVNELVDKKIFPREAKGEYEKSYDLWVKRRGHYDDYIAGVVRAFEGYLRGVSYEDFMRAVDDVSSREQDRVYRYTRDLVKELKDGGYYLLAISQSPKVILEKFCKAHGFDKVYGRMYETGPEGMFTGVTLDEHLIANKANIVRRAAEKENLTLQYSYGVGDSEGDIPFLELVEHPICFNPSNKLYRHAKIAGWRVVVERKDVIYEIPSGHKRT